ncbi:hypothetical protein LAV73_13990 [Lysinibacillus xylanilyticus]|uniref:hypothetical protein n=1 Tax=Lysinibacillus xylanilyticus TaxID=582475 RepID=UPI002B245ECE|nr:hypothetical protein [Lysinibacillus xylanilyticus]MEB2281095.1 hypothetical protein [Lysinibacillus xylanilyticus]
MLLFFKLDGVFGSDTAKDGRMVIDYTNRRFVLVFTNDASKSQAIITMYLILV